MPQPGRKHIHHIGLGHAWDGVKYAFLNHPNFKVHLVVSLIVLFLAWYIDLNIDRLLVLIFAIILGFSLEMINTSIEAVVDLVTQEWRQSAKVAKDVSAGAMLIVAIGTAIVGIIILGPELLEKLTTY